MNIVYNLLICFALFLAILLGSNSAFRVALDISNTANSSNWPSVPGTVTRFVDVDRSTRTKGWRDGEIVEYRYRVEGREYNGNRVSFSNRVRRNYRDIKPLTDPWRKNPTVSVYYNPSDPEQSVLQPGGGNFSNIAFFSGQLIFLIGLLAVLLLIFKQSIKSRVKPSRTRQ